MEPQLISQAQETEVHRHPPPYSPELNSDKNIRV